MKMPKWNKDMIKFSGRSHTKLGVFSAVIGFAVVIGFISISMISAKSRGDGGLILGLMGLLLFGMAIFGFVIAYKSFQQKDIYYRFPIIGVALNGIMTVLLLMIYIIGFGG